MSPLRIRTCAASLVIGLAPLLGCSAIQDLTQGAGASSDPRVDEIAGGLKQALSKGTLQAVSALAQEGGYLNDPGMRIPFPEEARFAADALSKIGLGALVENFEKRLNQGAEAGAERALPIFEDAIRNMSFADVREVLLGGEHAATDYFHDQTYDALVEAFRPEIGGALEEVGANEIWTEISTRYNSIPFASKKVDTDIVHYATGRALDGMFTKLAAEEALIRADPMARTTGLLQKVFGYAERQK